MFLQKGTLVHALLFPIIGNIKNNSLEKIWNVFKRKFNLSNVGDCPMNDSMIREELKRIIGSIRED